MKLIPGKTMHLFEPGIVNKSIVQNRRPGRSLCLPAKEYKVHQNRRIALERVFVIRFNRLAPERYFADDNSLSSGVGDVNAVEGIGGKRPPFYELVENVPDRAAQCDARAGDRNAGPPFHMQ